MYRVCLSRERQKMVLSYLIYVAGDCRCVSVAGQIRPISDDCSPNVAVAAIQASIFAVSLFGCSQVVGCRRNIFP